VEGWGKIVAGVMLGVAGTVYATNEDVRKRLPKSARDLPENLRQRFGTAVSAAREASTRRRDEILRDLEAHEAHAARPVRPAPEVKPEAVVPAGDEPPKLTGSNEEGSA
jgi:cation transport regulator ChaB